MVIGEWLSGRSVTWVTADGLVEVACTMAEDLESELSAELGHFEKLRPV